MDFKNKVATWQKQASGSLSKTAALGTIPSLIGAGNVLGLLDEGLELFGKPFGPALNTYGYQLDKKLHGGVSGTMDRIKADEMVASSLVNRATDRMADITEGLLGDIAKKAKKNMVDDPKRAQIFAHLVKTDDIIGSADKRSLLEAYDSMAKFAPTLSTNLSATKSFLREAAQHDGGIDYMTIKGLGQAERAVTGKSVGND
jgi:hypothetical protein